MLLDTHALLWWQAGGNRLSAKARRAIQRAQTVYVSPMSIWETGMLLQKNRVTLDRDLQAWTQDLFTDPRIRSAPLTPDAAAAAALLEESFPGDPADRFIYVTARSVFADLISKDQRIQTYAIKAKDLTVIW